MPPPTTSLLFQSLVLFLLLLTPFVSSLAIPYVYYREGVRGAGEKGCKVEIVWSRVLYLRHVTLL